MSRIPPIAIVAISLLPTISYAQSIRDHICKDVSTVAISTSNLASMTSKSKFNYRFRNDSMFMVGSGDVFMDKIIPIGDNKFAVGGMYLNRLPGNDFLLAEISNDAVRVSKLKCKISLKW